MVSPESMKTALRGMAVWCCLIMVEALHGIARTMLLAPALGDFRARQVAVLTGSMLILIVASSFIRWIRPVDAGEALAIGTIWLILTLTFEMLFGRYVIHASWSRIASDYNLIRGGTASDWLDSADRGAPRRGQVEARAVTIREDPSAGRMRSVPPVLASRQNIRPS